MHSRNLLKACIFKFSSQSSPQVFNRLVTLRHGQSIWNKSKQWAGWTDVPLSYEGIQEAIDCAKMLREKQIVVDYAYTSMLKRTVQTLNYILDQMDYHFVPLQKSWRLNEKHYGQLEGYFKPEAVKQFSEEKVVQWRRSLDVPPPKVKITDPRHPCHDPRYSKVPPEELPSGQCINDVIARFKPFYEKQLFPRIKRGERVLVVTHGSVLRAFLKLLFDQKDEVISNFNTPNVTPLVFDFDKDMKPIRYYMMGDKEIIKHKMEDVANEIKSSSPH